jgi:hypothetical protein
MRRRRPGRQNGAVRLLPGVALVVLFGLLLTALGSAGLRLDERFHAS